MKSVYPVFIKQHGKDFLVYVPDFNGYTEGTSLTDAIKMARDYIGAMGITYEDGNMSLPESSDYEEALRKAKENTEIFDYSDGMLTMVDVDFVEYRKLLDNRTVRKNCTIPYWLTVEADKAGINYSRVLQEAIANILNLNYNSAN